MKVVILAGGRGTRMGAQTDLLPKPMVSIGGRPVLWHIMKGYAARGYREFIVCCGYRQEMIREYFSQGVLPAGTVPQDLFRLSVPGVGKSASPWTITLADTGEQTMTGGRLLRIRPLLEDRPFMLTYGDGLSDVNPADVAAFHLRGIQTVTLTAVQPEPQFGILEMDPDGVVRAFQEKKRSVGPWINGGFMVMNPEIFDLLEDDRTILEQGPLDRLAREGKLSAWRHRGFWRCMDTPGDRQALEKCWAGGRAPWKIWEDDE